MFTGLIEETGRIKSLSGSILTVQTGLWESSMQGDSIAVDGTCLTVVEKGNQTLSFQCSRETISRTIIAEYHPGTEVNLERPLKLSDGLHGHLVTGHVDETVPVLKVERAGKDMTI